MKHGANLCRSIDIDALVRAYWNESGWDPASGLPLPATIVDLGLDKFISTE